MANEGMIQIRMDPDTERRLRKWKNSDLDKGWAKAYEKARTSIVKSNLTRMKSKLDRTTSRQLGFHKQYFNRTVKDNRIRRTHVFEDFASVSMRDKQDPTWQGLTKPKGISMVHKGKGLRLFGLAPKPGKFAAPVSRWDKRIKGAFLKPKSGKKDEYWLLSPETHPARATWNGKKFHALARYKGAQRKSRLIFEKVGLQNMPKLSKRIEKVMTKAYTKYLKKTGLSR